MDDMNKKLESTLNSIDGLQRAEAPTFFHTRVQARLEKKLATPSEVWLPVRRPAWVIASLALLLAANVFLLSQPKKDSVTENAETSTIQGFANSYGLTTSSGY
jgi:hypothetical protein